MTSAIDGVLSTTTFTRDQKLSEIWRKVEEARECESPCWVKGPRPSNECIAMHREEDTLSDEIIDLDLAKMFQLRDPDLDDLDSYPKPPLPPSFHAEEVEARGVRCSWVKWPGTDLSSGVVLYLHGGAGITGHRDVEWCAQLSRITSKVVLTVDYRLAPEHPMPAATEDAVQVYQWLVQDLEVPPGGIAIYGRSFGAMLVVLVLQELLRQVVPLPACGVPVSAWAPHRTQPKHWDVVTGNVDGNGQNTGKNYDKHDAKYNLFAGEFAGLPPLYVMVGQHEHKERDLNVSIQLAKVAAEAGVTTELDIVPHTQHCPDNFLGFVPEALQAVARAAKFIDTMVHMRA